VPGLPDLTITEQSDKAFYTSPQRPPQLAASFFLISIGRELITPEDAGDYITQLPRSEHAAPQWQAAIQALMLVSRGGPTMLA
jgi:hypothetical protein